MFDGVGEEGEWVKVIGEEGDRWSDQCDDGVWEEGEWEMRWSVRGRGWDWSGLCDRDDE